MIKYKKDVLKALKNTKYSGYFLNKHKILNNKTQDKLRNNDTSITLSTLNTLCLLLDCDVSDLITFEPDAIEDALRDTWREKRDGCS